MSAVIINKVTLFLKNEIICANVSRTKTYAFIAIVLRCFSGIY